MEEVSWATYMGQSDRLLSYLITVCHLSHGYIFKLQIVLTYVTMLTIHAPEACPLHSLQTGYFRSTVTHKSMNPQNHPYLY